MAIKHGSKVDKAFSAASMTDLMFLLLLFMLMATTLINPNALRLSLPKSSNQINEKAFTTVSIDAYKNFYIELEPVSKGQLGELLRVQLSEVENPTISLHADKSVPIDEVVYVMNIAKEHDWRLILATETE
jgi:biopolymer transport protein ExbD